MLKDSRNFMWFTSLEGLNRFDGHHFRVYSQNDLDPAALRGTATFGLVEDPYGNIWTGTEICLNRYGRRSDNFDFVYAEDDQGQAVPATHYPFYADSTEVWYTNSIEGIVAFNFVDGEKRILSDRFLYQGTSSIINSTLMGVDGKIWIRDWQGLISLDPSDGQLDYYFTDEVSDAIGPPTAFTSHLPVEDGTLWLSKSGGLVHLDPDAGEWTFYPVDPNGSLLGIQQTPDGLFYLGTLYSGLYLFRPEEGVVGQLTVENSTISGSSVASIYIDEDGLVWINPDPDGIDLLFPDFNGFNRFGKEFFEPFGFSSSGIRCFEEAPNGDIWVGTNKDGVFVFDPVQKKLVRRLSPFGTDGLSENHASFIHFDWEGRIWAGTYYGLFLSEDGNIFQRVENGIPFRLNHPSHEYWDIKETPEGYLFVSTSDGLFYIPPAESKAYPVKGFEGLSLGDVERFGDYLLVSEYIRGARVFNYREWLENDRSLASIQQPIGHYNIKHFAPRGDSLLWLATNKGVLKTKPSKDFEKIEILTSYTRSEGLASDYVYGLLWDETGKIWMSTNRGVAQLEPESGFIKTYDLKDNIQGYEFNTNAYLKSRRGDLFFGGTQGFNQLHPPIDGNPATPSIQLTELNINGEAYQRGIYIGEAGSIQLKPAENTFDLSFVATDYWSSGDNRYRVRLRGYEQDWVELADGRIRYTQVPPGQYVFEALASNGDGEWTEDPKTLQISIAAPWYRSNWAFLVYLLTAAFIFYQIYQFRKRRRALRQKLLIEQMEAERLKELDNMKSRFYTNITHEFRTPLTIILGLADQIRENPRWKVTEFTTLIKRNSRKLLQLINQMLDLSRLEAGKMEPEYIQGDIIEYLSYLIESFHSLGLDRHISVTFHTEADRLVMDYDPEKFQQIIDNLVSNALKFTPQYGKVSVVARAITEPAEKQWLEVMIRDTGIGIPKEKLPFIFDRFYQVDNSSVRKGEGTGLGLALVRELLELMGGSIRVDSETKRGTTFTFRLPVHHEAPLVSAVPMDRPFVTDRVGPAHSETGHDLSREPLTDKETSTVLLVEDNPDVITYLRSCLQDRYQLLEARNGRAGIDQALEAIPDLVISDVMMPEMNGFELCKILKTDERTNHIPIVLLTAKATQTDRIEGLSLGADAYLAKPFQKEELLVRLKQLLELRRQLQQKYQSDSLEVKETEDPFLQKVKAVINHHLDDPDLSVQQLSREVGMSRVQLHRKLKALTDRSTTQLIREIRLQKAYDLLQHSYLNISEIAYQVGFKDPGYFSRSFSQYYNCSPSELRK